MRQIYIAGNWKMNNVTSESIKLAEELKAALGGSRQKIMVAPPFTSICAVEKVLKHSNIVLGAQNMSGEESGAYTGEVSADMLIDVGVKVVILGHSERRIIYGETDEFINRKVKLAIKKGLEVILCVGETLEQRENGIADSVVREQVKKGFSDITAEQLSSVTIAYEPVWAIGTGKTATPQDADVIHKTIRSTITELYSNEASEKMIIQYGGSVKPENVKELMAMENIDGALVGGASLKSGTFIPLVKFDE